MKFLIYRNPKSAMQSGKKNSKKWLMILVEENNSRSLSSPLSWVSSSDTSTQLKFNFASKDQAIEFAKQRGFEYQIIEEQNPLILPKSYANNFL